MSNFNTILKWRWLRALQFWNHLPIRAQGGITVFIPLVAVLISFGFALWGNHNRTAINYDVERKFKAVRQYGDLLTLMVDAETGERGFVLTDRAEYLEPYKRAVAEIPPTIAELKQTIETEPGEKPRLERLEGLAKIEELTNRQLASLKESQNLAGNNVSRNELNEHLRRGKALMDEIRAVIGGLQNKEETLLNERLEEINTIRQRDYILIFITLTIGIFVRVVSFYLFDRGIVRRVNRLSEYVGAMTAGKTLHFAVSKKTDAVGELEDKIVALAARIENKIDGKPKENLNR